jgi:hypothetical protein
MHAGQVAPTQSATGQLAARATQLAGVTPPSSPEFWSLLCFPEPQLLD